MTWAKDVWPSERARLMSGHMMPTEREAFEESRMVLELFRELNDMGGSMRCDFNHRDESPGCSIEVTHRFAACTLDGNICANAAAVDRERMSMPGARCGGCLAPLPDCWDLWPI